jgi:saccharopine dehydrogenase (NAD+, L-lysine-forming)
MRKINYFLPILVCLMCFDSPGLTALVGFMRKTGLSSLFKGKIIQNLAIKSFSHLAFGSEIFAVRVIGKNKEDGEYACSISGSGEGKITALVTSMVDKKIMTQNLPSGIHHIEELFKPNEFMEELQQNDPKLNLNL